MSRLGDFQPADPPEEDIDAKWDAWFAQQEKNGYAVISRDEWKEKLNTAAYDGYAEGRKDQREELAALILVVEQILDAGHMNTEDLAQLRAAWEQS